MACGAASPALGGGGPTAARGGPADVGPEAEKDRGAESRQVFYDP